MPRPCALQALLEKENLNLEDLERILGPRPFKAGGLRNIDRYRAARGTPGAEQAKPQAEEEAAGKEQPVPI